MSIRIEKISRFKVTGMSHRGPYHTIGATWAAMDQWLANHGKTEQERYSMYLDDPSTVAPEELKSVAAVAAKGMKPSDELVNKFIAGGYYAVMEYIGPYEGLPNAWASMAQAVADSKEMEQRPGICFEHYLNSPNLLPAAELKTVLYVPINRIKGKKKS